MLIRGHFVCHVHCLVHDGAVQSSPCGPHHENFGRNLFHMFVLAYFASQSFVLFLLWYSSCFNVKCWFHTFSKWCSHVSMGVLTLLSHQECHPNSISNRCASLQVDPIIFNIRKINSKFSQRCLFHPSQVVFVFPPSHPFFFKDSDFLIEYPFYWWEVSPFFSVNVLIRWFSWRF